MYISATIIFLSSFLLFLVQPLFGKLLLPAFGGTSSVWTTCMLFFQALLLIGYGYAHLCITRLNSRQLFTVHLLLAIASIVIYSASMGNTPAPNDYDSPVAYIVLFLLTSIGLPYLLLSSTAPLLQGILGKNDQSASIYRLYALSNFGSLLALISYPVAVEPLLPLTQQRHLWFLGYALYLVLIGVFLSRNKTRAPEKVSSNQSELHASPDVYHHFRWFLYAGVGCLILLASTNHICQNIASCSNCS